MKPISLVILAVISILSTSGGEEKELPFDPAKISRLSLDGIPRSVSVRQGGDVWLGYDLEKAFLFKVWQAPEKKPGLIVKGFKSVSAGTVWFEKKKSEAWQLNDNGKTVPLGIRYIGCTQEAEHFELRWEFSHPGGDIMFSERIPNASASGPVRAYRELRVESLEAGASLILPATYRKGWELNCPDGKAVKALTGSGWHKISLR